MALTHALANAVGATGAHRVRALLAGRGYRRLLVVRLLGQAGDGLFQGALVGAAFFNPEKATSAGEAAAAFAVVLLPYSLVGPFAGVGLDRWSRQRTLLVTNTARTVLLVLLAASLAASGPTSAATLAVALLAVSLNRFVLSCLGAGLPHVVETRRLVTANAFTTTVGAAATAVGGGASLLLRTVWGTGDTYAARAALVAGAVYLVAGLAATRLTRDELGPDDEQPPLRHALAAVVRDMVTGAQHLAERPPAARALLTIGSYRFFSGLLFVATLLLYTPHGYLHRGFAGLGQVVTATGVGGLLAALVTPRVTRRVGTQPWIVVVLAGAAVVTTVFAPLARHPALLAAGLGLGFAGQAAKICVDTLVQESVEDDFRGRVFTLYDTLFNVGFVAAAATAALVVPPNGRSVAVALAVAAGLAATATTYAALVRRAHEPPEPVRER